MRYTCYKLGGNLYLMSLTSKHVNIRTANIQHTATTVPPRTPHVNCGSVETRWGEGEWRGYRAGILKGSTTVIQRKGCAGVKGAYTGSQNYGKCHRSHNYDGANCCLSTSLSWEPFFVCFSCIYFLQFFLNKRSGRHAVPYMSKYCHKRRLGSQSTYNKRKGRPTIITTIRSHLQLPPDVLITTTTLRNADSLFRLSTTLLKSLTLVFGPLPRTVKPTEHESENV